MNYLRVMRILSGRKVTAPLAGVMLILAGCAAEESAPPAAAGPCEIVANGTPVSKAPPEPPPGAVTTSRNISTNPEVATGYRKDMTAVRTASYAVVTANPLATQAACEVLRDGGTAADALVAAQAVLGLVEPQASGIGGGGFLLYYDAAGGAVQAYDGREVAPAAATENYLQWISDTDRTEPKPDARASGRSIGVPGILRLLQDAHAQHGKTAWRDLFNPAVALADDGFDISPRLAAAIADCRPAAEGRSERLGLLPQLRWQSQGLRHSTDEPGLFEDVGRHRIRSSVVLHRRHRPEHRGGRGRHQRRPHPEPDDARGPVRLHRQEP